MARHLQIPLELKKALSLIQSGRIISIDSIKINNEYFFCTAGIGIDAYISWRFAEAKKRGFWSYLKITLKSFFKYQPFDYEIITTNGKEIYKNVMLATIANANQFGNNVIISPNSIINDGFLRLIIVTKFPLIYLPIFTYKLLSKKINTFKYCKELKVKDCTIINNDNKIHLDGEPIEMDNIMQIEVLQNSLKIIVP